MPVNFILTAALCTGCLYGIERTAFTASTPTLGCVESAVQSVPGIKRTYSLLQLLYYSIFYWTFEPSGAIDPRQGFSGEITVFFRDSRVRHEIFYPTKPPMDLICGYRTKMDELERIVAEWCEIPELVDQRHERYRRVRCQ
jgi:hypothetical protein